MATTAEADQVDQSYGTGGYAEVSRVDSIFGITALPSGAVIVSARRGDEAILLKLDPSGQPVSDFGGDGDVSLGESGGYPRTIATPDGGIVMATVESPDSTLVTKLLPGGELDTSFGGGDGLVTLDGFRGGLVGDRGAEGFLLAGNLGLARVTDDGELDTSFGSNGYASTGDVQGIDETAVLTDGTIVVQGSVGDYRAGTMRIGLHPDGSVDPGFEEWRSGPGYIEVYEATLAADPTGGFFEVTYSCGRSVWCPPALSHFDGDGGETFGGVDTAGGTSLAVDSAGRAVSAGVPEQGPEYTFLGFPLVRNLPTGELDESFGDGGLAYLLTQDGLDVWPHGVDAAGGHYYVSGEVFDRDTPSWEEEPGPWVIGRLLEDADDDPPLIAEGGTSDRSISLTAKRRGAKGAVRAAGRECRAGSQVKVLRKQQGDDRRVGKATARKSGAWRLERRLKEGRYYAVATRSGGDCSKARSRTVKVR